MKLSNLIDRLRRSRAQENVSSRDRRRAISGAACTVIVLGDLPDGDVMPVGHETTKGRAIANINAFSHHLGSNAKASIYTFAAAEAPGRVGVGGAAQPVEQVT